MQKTIKNSWIVILVLFSSFTQAQNNTNSPYSRFGYGEIADNTSGKSKAMGGTFIGVRSNNCINAANPASYTGIDSLTFMFEFGAVAKQSRFSNTSGRMDTLSANIEYITLQFPIKRWLAASAGLLPYSFVGYNFSQNDSISRPTLSGTEQVVYEKTFLGSGSINQVYLGLSAKIGKHIAVGVNTSYMFGSIENKQQLNFLSPSDYWDTDKISKLTVRDINFRYALQYFTNVSKKAQLTAGVIVENKSNLAGNYSVEISDVDTISSANNSTFQTPFVLGLGLSYDVKNKLALAADFLYHDWSDVNYFGVKDTLMDKMKFSVGAEYLPSINSKSYIKRITYRLGGYVTNDYLSINKNVLNYGITFGLALPTKANKSVFNLGFEYGKVGSTLNNQIREDYFKISLNTTFSEMWFFKRRFE
ncbi:MAG: hypothetical protein JXQ69_04970 [Paludibacteraceae bacterium]|nr:hypothetical protein [Paludibacteraceae bacterium]MBN2787661.1 hypothetical protein [Paludibacteraceae bacterium]